MDLWYRNATALPTEPQPLPFCLIILQQTRAGKLSVAQTQADIGYLFGPFQCDQIGRFLKILCVKGSFKFSTNVCWLFRLFLKTPLFKWKLLCLHSGQLLENFGLLLISSSGHTGPFITKRSKCTNTRLWNTQLDVASNRLLFKKWTHLCLFFIFVLFSSQFKYK